MMLGKPLNWHHLANFVCIMTAVILYSLVKPQ